MPFDADQSPLYYRSAGEGPLVICLHASASSSSQWDRLIATGEHAHRFIAVDLHGHGRSAPASGPYRLSTETAAVERLLGAITGPVHVVGHSFGGAVALDLALRLGNALGSVTVYEPVLFSLLEHDSAEYREIRSMGSSVVRHARAGERSIAAARFIDYWSGQGTWEALPPAAQLRIEQRIGSVSRHFEALFENPLPHARLQALRAPVLLLQGAMSPAPPLAVARRLATLPAVRLDTIAAAAHMGPITHADEVNRRILDHITTAARRSERLAA